MKLVQIALATVALAAGCEKAGSNAGTGTTKGELALLADLPGGNVAIFGGNYMKMQNFMQSSLGKLTGNLMDKATGNSMNAWMDCFSKHHLEVAGGIALIPGGGLMRMAFRGLTLTDVKACADSAQLAATFDPDNKYLAVTMPANGTSYTFGYLALADGALYARQQLGLGGVMPVTRADLEADAASTKKASAASDKALLAIAAKTDHGQFWIAGRGTGTPFEDKLGEARASFSLDDGIKADIHVQFVDESIAKRIEQTTSSKARVAMPPQFQAILDGVHIERDGGKIHATVTLTDVQIAAAMKPTE